MGDAYLMSAESFSELMHIRGALRVKGDKEMSDRITALDIRKVFDVDEVLEDYEDCASCHAYYKPPEWWDNMPGYDPAKCGECQYDGPAEIDYDATTLDEQCEKARREK